MKKDASFSGKPPSSNPRAAEAFAATMNSMGITPPPEPMKRLTVDVPLSLHTRVKTRCVQNNTPIAEVIRSFLETKFPEDSIAE